MHQSVESSPSSKMWRSQGSRRVIPIQSSSSTLDKLLPFKICIWDSDGEAGDITCDIVDSTDVLTRRLQINEDKKAGRAISKGHKRYDLTLSLQLGIRHSVGINSGSDVELRAADFDPREGLWTRFPSEGSEITPPHRAAEFRWRDYCPEVFRHLRKLFAVDPANYVMSICGSGTLRELSSQGKSGSSFFVTQDGHFMIKTVKISEVKVLIRMLPGYYRHVHRYEKSLITRFFGVHCVKPVGGQKVHFVVMGNLFCSEHRIHRRFDLKGSSHGRSTNKAEIEFDETTTLKDLDLNFVFRLQTSWFREFFWQIERDCEFLEAEGIMDYSLLVGVNFNDDISASKMGFFSQEISCKWDSFKRGELKDLDWIVENRKRAIRLGSNVPAKAECIRSDFGPSIPRRSGEICNVVLYFGIIDILQDYGINKKLEHAYKSLQADPSSISAVDPTHYSRRFRDFIRTVFIEDEDR